MRKGTLPIEEAFEPDERAHQPMEEAMTPRLERQPSRKLLSFAEDTDLEDKPSSQRSSQTYKDALSQPPSGLSHRQKLLWLQNRRKPGLWAQCDTCNQWRYLPDVIDSHDLPDQWYCRMNPDKSFADCSVPETPIRLRDEEDLIHSEYSAGSVVWARMAGWPWWPAMVDDCPDIEQFYWLDGFSDIPTHYNVVFFDSSDVTRAWISPENLKPYVANKKNFKPFLKDKKYKQRLQAALTQADDASKLSLVDRLRKYSFIARYKGNFNTPKKFNKKDLKKHQKYLKRKFDIELESSDSDEDVVVPKPKTKKNMIILGTKKASTNTKASETGVFRNGKDAELSIEKPVETMPENFGNTETEISNKTSETDNNLMRPSSLVVQDGSASNTTMNIDTFDYDTSKTYVPDNIKEQTTQDTEYISHTLSQLPEFKARIPSPHSDDFDF